METKTRDEILLDEKVAKIDDINFNKIYGLEEVVNKELENFNAETIQAEPSTQEKEEIKEESIEEPENAFSIEIQPNEFLDNMKWDHEEEEEVVKKPKLVLKNKPLFYAFTSIAVLLCILFVYNMFVIRSLEMSVGNNDSSANMVVEENSYIKFDNNNTMEIAEKTYTVEKNDFSQTNWFDSLCEGVNQLFGGSH